MIHRRLLTGLLLGAPIALTLVAAIIVTNVLPGIFGGGSFRAQVEVGDACTDGSDNDSDNRIDWMRSDTILPFTDAGMAPFAVVTDSAGQYAYAATSTAVIKVRLSDYTEVGRLTTSVFTMAAALDTTAGVGYFVTQSEPSPMNPQTANAKILKVRLSDMTQIGSANLPSGQVLVTGIALDPQSGNGYLSGVLNGLRVQVYNFSLASLAFSGPLSFGNDLTTMMAPLVLDASRGYAYTGARFSDSNGVAVNLYRIRLSDFTAAGQVLVADSSHPGVFASSSDMFSPDFRGAAIDTSGGYAYFGLLNNSGNLENFVARVSLSDFSGVCVLPLSNMDGSTSMNMSTDSANHVLYIATGIAGNGGKLMEKIRLSDFSEGGAVEFPQGAPTGVRTIAGMNGLDLAVDPAGTYAYVGTYTYNSPGYPELLRMNLGDAQCMSEEDGNEGAHTDSEPSYSCTGATQSSSVPASSSAAPVSSGAASSSARSSSARASSGASSARSSSAGSAGSGSSGSAGSSGSLCPQVCGDGLAVPPEQCDDGNLQNGDCCSATCTTEPGCSCTPAPAFTNAKPSQCAPICGDRKVTWYEQCDDGNVQSGDGCSSTCRIEGTRSSSSKNSNSSLCATCIPQNCGNNVLETPLGEECDDGNTKSGDGCSLQCKIERVTCPADPCGMGGEKFCELQGKKCQLDATKTSCITCTGSEYICKGDECDAGGKTYCSKIGNNKCVPIADGICIDCKNVCQGTECGLGGEKYCDLYGKQCVSDMGSDACIDCVPEPPIECTGTDAECKSGGTAYCSLLGETCAPKADGICISCLPPGTCKGGECDLGGENYCSTVRGSHCSETPDGICISCGNKQSQQCEGNECRKGGANYCKTLGEGCRNVGYGLCIDCVQDTRCTDDLQCAQGSKCVNGACVVLCGNKRLDAGEVCDPTVGGAGGRGCTPDCLLAENQQCERDTECGSTLCIRNICIPCTAGGQCQSNECREGVCANLCGNGKLDPGEICDPGLAGASGDCTNACLRPVGSVCAKNFECQTGLCGGGACIRCERNNQCGSGICASGACVDVCGNGALDRDEQCDDGNRITGDGCSRFCERESRVAGELLPLTLLGDVTQGGNVRGMDEAGRIAKGHAAAGETGPAAVVAIAGGAAAGWSWMRRRRRR